MSNKKNPIDSGLKPDSKGEGDLFIAAIFWTKFMMFHLNNIALLRPKFGVISDKPKMAISFFAIFAYMLLARTEAVMQSYEGFAFELMLTTLVVMFFTIRRRWNISLFCAVLGGSAVVDFYFCLFQWFDGNGIECLPFFLVMKVVWGVSLYDSYVSGPSEFRVKGYSHKKVEL